jgi:hypothetical protein
MYYLWFLDAWSMEKIGQSNSKIASGGHVFNSKKP